MRCKIFSEVTQSILVDYLVADHRLGLQQVQLELDSVYIGRAFVPLAVILGDSELGLTRVKSILLDYFLLCSCKKLSFLRLIILLRQSRCSLLGGRVNWRVIVLVVHVTALTLVRRRAVHIVSHVGWRALVGFYLRHLVVSFERIKNVTDFETHVCWLQGTARENTFLEATGARTHVGGHMELPRDSECGLLQTEPFGILPGHYVGPLRSSFVEPFLTATSAVHPFPRFCLKMILNSGLGL